MNWQEWFNNFGSCEMAEAEMRGDGMFGAVSISAEQVYQAFRSRLLDEIYGPAFGVAPPIDSSTPARYGIYRRQDGTLVMGTLSAKESDTQN